MDFQYPSHLLHSSDFQLIDFEEYRTDAVLIRHTESKDIWDDNELLKTEYIAAQTDHLRDYSTNLLGVFQLEDIGYKILRSSENAAYFGELFDINSYTGKIPIYEEDFIFEAQRGHFLLRAKDFHRQKIRYDEIDGSEFTCHVLHTPINANVWHCSLRWFNNAGEDSSLLSKSQRRRMLAAAKSHIISHAFQF